MSEVLAVFFALTSLVLIFVMCAMRGHANSRIIHENEELREQISQTKHESDTTHQEAIKIVLETRESAQLQIQRARSEAHEQIKKTQHEAYEKQTALVLEWNAKIERSRRLKTLVEAEQEAERIVREAKNIREDAEKHILSARETEKQASVKLNEADEALKTAKWEGKSLIQEAESKAKQVIENAKKDASRQAEAMSALRVKEIQKRESELDLLKRTAEAMRNTIEGYGDQYLIPSHSLTDDLAEDFGHKEAGQKLKEARLRSRQMVEDGESATCDYVEKGRRENAIRFVLDAFNGKVDSALASVKHDNFGKMRQEIRDGFLLVNRTGAAFRGARITDAYLESRLDELKWACAALELRREEQEEQKAIRERMREEEKARREYEKAKRDAEKEEARIRKEIEQARRMAEMESASAAQREKYEAMLRDLEGKLTEAELRGQRAISMAQQTKQGNVYIISNVGSFGENVLKIGMTRRLVPEDRVNELSNASVPFRFDIHAMIFSTDAPALETSLHRHFALLQMNKVNHRKEFFRVPLSEVRSIVESLGLADVHWTMAAEAREYRETQKIEEDILNNPVVRDEWLARQIRLDAEDERSFNNDDDATSDDDDEQP
jgi:T5orf172 domain.